MLCDAVAVECPASQRCDSRRQQAIRMQHRNRKSAVSPGVLQAVAIGLLIASACNGPPTSAEERSRDAEAVRAASRAWDTAHNAGNVAALITLYAGDAVSMPFGRPPLEGRAAIEADFRSFFAEFTADHRTTIVALELAGDVAIERGTYELSIRPKNGTPGTSERGKHIVVRRRTDEGWQIQWEIWNTNSEAPK